MASFIKRNGRWTSRVMKTGYPETTQTFASKSSALKWTQRVESDPERFLPEQVSEDHQLKTGGDLLRKYEREVTPQKKGRDKEKYRLRILQSSPLSGVLLRGLRAHHITKFRDDRLKEVATGTVLKDLYPTAAVSRRIDRHGSRLAANSENFLGVKTLPSFMPRTMIASLSGP